MPASIRPWPRGISTSSLPKPLIDMDDLPFARTGVSILSPLRYPGAKRRLAGYIERVVVLNRLRPALFVEPFAGGASVALQLLNNRVVERIGLIERDPLVAAFWQTVFSDADWLVEQVETVEVTLERWYDYKRGVPTDTRGRALACLFLNRTSFSGILVQHQARMSGIECHHAANVRKLVDFLSRSGALIMH